MHCCLLDWAVAWRDGSGAVVCGADVLQALRAARMRALARVRYDMAILSKLGGGYLKTAFGFSGSLWVI